MPLDSWLPPHPPLPPCLSIQWIALPLSSPALHWRRVEGLELSVRQLQATTSLQLDSSTATAQATSSAALARPSPGNTHSLDRETPSTPRSPESPASLQGYTGDEYLNTGPTVAQSTQPQPAVPFSHLFFLADRQAGKQAFLLARYLKDRQRDGQIDKKSRESDRLTNRRAGRQTGRGTACVLIRG